jgi:hypothetical protein
MDTIFKYLSRYKNLTPPEASKKKIVIQVIQDECGIQITEKEIQIKREGVLLSCHPTVRSELTRCAPRVIHTLLKKHNVRISFIR